MEVETFAAQHDGHFSSKIGTISAPNPHANTLVDDFASKTNLLGGEECENMVEDEEDHDSDDYDSLFGEEEPTHAYLDKCEVSANRFVIENGEEVVKPGNRTLIRPPPIVGYEGLALHNLNLVVMPQRSCFRIATNKNRVENCIEMWHVYLKDGPPEGCDNVDYHLEILEQVVGSDALDVYDEIITATQFATILTDEEHGKLIGLKEVVKTSKVKDWLYFY